MAIKELKRFKPSNDELSRLQDNVYEFTRQLPQVTLSGELITGVVIGTSTTLIDHKLGRAFQGWHLADIRGDARVWRDASSTSDATKFLPLKASASVTVSLWVF